MIPVSVRAYPWEVEDEMLDRLYGEVGVSGVSIWAAAPPILQLRAPAGAADRPRIVRSSGGLMFQPRPEHYGATRCKPRSADGVRGRPLEAIAQACAERGLELRAVVSGGRLGRIADKHPEMCCRNAFGDRSSFSLCVMNPDVQALLAALVDDLASNYAIAAVCLTDFESLWGEAFSSAEAPSGPGCGLPALDRAGLRTPVALGGTGKLLLGLCFCESCHQRGSGAKVDVAGAQRSVQAMLDTCLEEGEGFRGPLESFYPASEESIGAPEFAEFMTWREAELDSLLGRMVEACRRPVLLYRAFPEEASYRPADVGGSFPPSTRYASPAGVVTAIRGPEQLEGALCNAARRNELCLPASMAIGRHAPELVSTLARATTMGFSGFEIDDLGSLPVSALTAVKQAIRFARRTET